MPFFNDVGLGEWVYLVIAVIVLYPIGLSVYNLFFHPLSRFPGPKLWVVTRLPFIRSLWKGDLVHDIQKIHQKYGDIVRVAPNEVSFAKAEAMQDIYVQRPGLPPFQKNRAWFGPLPGQPESIVSLPTGKDHSRIRRLLNHSFTEKALQSQEPIIQKYVDLLITRLREQSSRKKDGVVDVAPWYNYITFDIVGDLAFAEPFNCLEDSNAIQSAKDHYQLAKDKVNHRLSLQVDRPDLMSHVLRHNDEKKDNSVSLPEIEATFNTIIIAGSETTATAITGATHCLIRNPTKLRMLVDEIRGVCAAGQDLTLPIVRDLPYLNAVLNESLRLCPPVPAGLARLVPQGGATVCGYWLPENTNVSVPNYTINRSPRNFHDPESFCPERWLSPALNDPSSTFYNDIRTASQPFSLGRRQCIGKEFAGAEIRLTLARVIWEFNLFPAETKAGRLKWEDLRTYQLLEKAAFDVVLRSRS